MEDELVAAGRLHRLRDALPKLAHGAGGGRRGEGLVHLAQVGIAVHVAARAEAAHARAAVGEVVQLRPAPRKRRHQWSCFVWGLEIWASELRRPALRLPLLSLSSSALRARMVDITEAASRLLVMQGQVTGAALMHG